MVGGLPANAGDMGSVPGQGGSYIPQCKSAHAPQQEKPLQKEVHTLKLESSPRSPQLEKTHAQQRRPRTAKNKYRENNHTPQLMLLYDIWGGVF